MKLARLLDEDFHGALRRLNLQVLPLKAAFALKGIQKNIQQELLKYEETRKEALSRFGKKDTDGNLITDEAQNVLFEEEDQLQFIKELNDLLDMEVEIGTLSIESLGDKVEITGQDLAMLEGLIQ